MRLARRLGRFRILVVLTIIACGVSGMLLASRHLWLTQRQAENSEVGSWRLWLAWSRAYAGALLSLRWWHRWRYAKMNLHAPDSCAATLGYPKIALLFLSRGVMHHEPLWAQWFGDAQGLLPLGAVQALGCGPQQQRALRRACSALEGDWSGPIQKQHLASVYVHVGLENITAGSPAAIGEGSIFHRLDIWERYSLEWGSFGPVDAARALMRVALWDNSNEKFMLLSESTIPLYPLATLWQQLTWETKSRIDDCEPVDEQDEAATQLRRWTPDMAFMGPSDAQWRKSSPWVTLRRWAVEVIMNDNFLEEVFREHCFGQWDLEGHNFRDCWPEEHYVPTLLSMMGEENESDCLGQAVHTTWRSPTDSHPASWLEHEITHGRLLDMQRTVPGCHPQAAMRSAAGQLINKTTIMIDSCQRPLRPYRSLGYRCSLAAQNFGPEAAAKVLSVLRDCEGSLDILNNLRTCSAEAPSVAAQKR